MEDTKTLEDLLSNPEDLFNALMEAYPANSNEPTSRPDKTGNQNQKGTRKMSKNTTLKALFTSLHGTLPYEYDVTRVNGTGLEDTIVISKTGSDHTIYITANTIDDNTILDVTAYDDIYDDPAEIYQWDANDPNLNLIDLITHIKDNL